MQGANSIAIAARPQPMLVVEASSSYRSLDGGATWQITQLISSIWLLLAGLARRRSLLHSHDAAMVWSRRLLGYHGPGQS